MNRDIKTSELEEFDKIISRIVYLEKEKAQAIQQLKELEDRAGIPKIKVTGHWSVPPKMRIEKRHSHGDRFCLNLQIKEKKNRTY